MELTNKDLMKIVNSLDNTESAEQFMDKIMRNLENRTKEVKEMMKILRPEHIAYFANMINYPINLAVDCEIMTKVTNTINIGLALHTALQESVVEILEKENQNVRGK